MVHLKCWYLQVASMISSLWLIYYQFRMHQLGKKYIGRLVKPIDFRHREKIWATNEALIHRFWWRIRNATNTNLYGHSRSQKNQHNWTSCLGKKSEQRSIHDQLNLIMLEWTLTYKSIDTSGKSRKNYLLV